MRRPAKPGPCAAQAGPPGRRSEIHGASASNVTISENGNEDLRQAEVRDLHGGRKVTRRP